MRLSPALILLCTPICLLAAQPSDHSLTPRQVPCQAQYAHAVETIGLARWSAPEPERPAIERLLNAAAKAKELVDASFLQYDSSLCSSETLGRLHGSVNRLQRNGWLPSTPGEQRSAQTAAANAELLKAINAGTSEPASMDTETTPSDGDNVSVRRSLPE